MSDLIKKAAGLFFTVEDNDTDDKATPKQAPKSTPQDDDSHNSGGYGAIDEGSIKKYQAYFKKLYDQSNLPGPDFYEFNSMAEAMGNVIADNVKYPAVYAGFAGQLTKQKLVSSAETYLDIIQNDVKDFEQSFQSALNAKVADRKSQVNAKADQIKGLQEQIAKLNQEIVVLNQLAANDENKLQSERQAYYMESDGLTKKIQAGLEKIKQYIS